MRISQYCLPFLLTLVSWAGDSAPKTGYVDCSLGDKQKQTPVFSNPCGSQPVARLSCGEQVSVVAREGPWLKIASTDGVGRYVSVTAISQRKDRFLVVDIPSPPGPNVPDCSAFRSKTGSQPPSAVYQRDPDYSDEARKKHVEGTVLLSLTVGTDGLPRDIKVEKALGHGLDENAIQAVEQWRFEPALQDGEPIAKKIEVEVDFHLAK